MSARRQPPPARQAPAAPAVRDHETPEVSGEYRLFTDARDEAPSSPSTPGARPARPAPARPVRPAPGRPAPPARPASPASPPQRATQSYGGFHAVGRDSVPRRFDSFELEAVDAPVSGRMLDDALDFDIHLDTDPSLELDGRPSSHGTRVEMPRPSPADGPPSRRMTPSAVTRVTPRPMARVTSGGAPSPVTTAAARTSSAELAAPSTQTAAARRSSATIAVDPHDAIVAFAGFGEPPTTLWGTLAYAFRVIRRRRTLRGDLARARWRRSPDVGLYEASLRAADDAAVRNGLTLTAALFVFAVVLLGAAAWLLVGSGSSLQLPW